MSWCIDSAAKTKGDGKVEAEKIGAVLVFTRDEDVELARWDLAGQCDRLFEFVRSRR